MTIDVQAFRTADGAELLFEALDGDVSVGGPVTRVQIRDTAVDFGRTQWIWLGLLLVARWGRVR